MLRNNTKIRLTIVQAVFFKIKHINDFKNNAVLWDVLRQ